MSTHALTAKTKFAASLMRRLPTGVRRIRVWRDGLYAAVGAAGWEENEEVDRQWPAELQSTRGRMSGMRMQLDLTDWLQRRAYFTGRFYQEDLEELLSAVLRRGDNFVDVGANIGLITLHAAAIVGASGSVWAFEPNPEAYKRLSEHIQMNRLQCRAINAGLGTETGTLILTRSGRHTGKATLVGQADESAVSMPVQIFRGDSALEQLDVTKPTFFKIDVEGFEVSVLEGLGNRLDGNVAVVIEVSPSWLQRAGSSASRLFDVLDGHGLKPYTFELQQNRFTHRLMITPLRGPISIEQYDCLFMRPLSIFAQRLGI